MFYRLAKILVCLPPPLFKRVVNRLIARLYTAHPELAERLRPIDGRTILIKITDLTLRIMVSIRGGRLYINTLRPGPDPNSDAQIHAKLHDAVAIFCGEFDGDELFFSRRFIFEGQTETIVHLRNAFDGVDINPKDILPPFLAGTMQRQVHTLQGIRGIFRQDKSTADPVQKTALQQVSVLEQKILCMEGRLLKVEQQNNQS